MLQTLRNAWKVEEIRKKIIFVLAIMLIYCIGTAIPVPFVNREALTDGASMLSTGIFAYMNLLSGGALEQVTLFALGVSPYINASIIIQLLSVAIPALERKSKEGESGKKFISMLTRYVTVGLGALMALGYYFMLKNGGFLTAEAMSGNLAWFYGIVIVVCFCAGSSLVMWLAEKINENGLGNGISIILFTNIIASLPKTVIKLVSLFQSAASNPDDSKAGAFIWTSVITLVTIIGLIALAVFVIFVTGSERRIPIQYAKRTVGRKMYGGQSTNLPIKLNMTGVMPIIFASSFCSLPATIMMFCQVESAKTMEDPGFWNKFYDFCDPNGWFYAVMLFVLIIAFAYFYIQISFNPVEVANNLQKNGGVIMGIRQGRPTAEFISRILSRITFAGALFLGIVALLPIIAKAAFFGPAITEVLTGVTSAAYLENAVSYYASSFAFGGTSILIVTGVVEETARELESQLTMRNYKGFLN